MSPSPTRLDSEAADRRILTVSAVAAVALHVAVLLVPLPERSLPPVPAPEDDGPRILRAELPPPDVERPEVPPPRVREQRVWIVADETPSDDPLVERPVEVAADAVESWDDPLVPATPEPPPVAEPGPVDVDTPGVLPPRPILEGRARPAYPRIAIVARREGVVTLLAVVDEHGAVTDLQVLEAPSPDHGFADAAMRAVRTWRYLPGTLDGHPIAVRMRVTVEFTLQE